MNNNITNDIIYIGVNDKDIDLFESQYKVPNGISYNSYLIKDDKNVLLDTVDIRKTDEWLDNLRNALNGESLDYLVISHMEPDHASNIGKIVELYPNITLVGNDKTFSMLPQFFSIPENINKITVKEGDSLNFGKHVLKFFMAPMVHWPEVMVEYDETEKIVFSADGFGKFGALDVNEEWDDEARRYYINIVGKFGMPVQTLLKKLATLDVKMICPLHGPILKENLSYYINKYDIWSSYKAEVKGTLVSYASIHGNTAKAARKTVELLKQTGESDVKLIDLSRDDVHEAVSDAFKYDKMILLASSYNGGVFTPMENFLNILKAKNFQNRKVAIVENGSWAPSATRCIKTALSEMKDITVVEPTVTIKSTLKEEDTNSLNELVQELIK